MGLIIVFIYIWVFFEFIMFICIFVFMGIYKFINFFYLLDVKVYRLDFIFLDYLGIFDFFLGDWILKFVESFRWYGWGDNGGWSWFFFEFFCGGFVFIFCVIFSVSKMYDYVIF